MKNRSVSKKYIIIFPLIIICMAVILMVCLACGDKTNDEHIHSFSETVIDPTCTESGYTLHTCACGESYKDSFVAAIGHTPQSAVRENLVPANCTIDGSYDEVIYCAVCNEKVSVEHKTINKFGHTPKAAVQENIVAASCTTNGSYDEVVYCYVCNEKVSVEHKTINKLGHKFADGVCSVCGEPEYYNIEDLQFTLSQDESYYTVSGFNGSPTYAYIPYTYNGKPVTSIGNNAFYNCTTLTRVIIPSSVTSIGNSAFEGCGNLTSVTMRSGLVSIGNSSFYKCSNLTNATIPESVTTIGQYAFEGCTALTSVSVPNSLVTIGKYAFSTCINVTSIYYAGNIGEFLNISGIDNLMGYAARKELYLNEEQVIDLVIPDSITSIADYAFYYCIGIKSITIGKSVTSIGNYAFAHCTSLESVYWNATACTGGWFTGSSSSAFIAGIFNDCDNLTTAIIGENVQSIPDYAFYWCRSLTSVNIPESVTSIGDSAFYYCTGLESITIGKGVTSIGNYAFTYCTGLESITIDKGVTTIGDYAFEYCASLETVYWNATACTGGWFNDGIKPIFYNCVNLTEAVIGDNVQAIPNYLFYHCDYLESITIGKGVTTIGKSAFAHCIALEIVYYNAIDCIDGWTVGSTIYTLFNDCGSLKTFVIGDGVEAIPDYLCYNCSSLESVVIPAGLTYIGKKAFYNCSGLNALYYFGAEDDYFTASTGNTEFMSAPLYYYSEDEPTDDGQWWHYDDNGNTVIW